MQNSNRFSSKFESKSTKELEAIISLSEDYQPEAIRAAEMELAKRNEDGRSEVNKPTEYLPPKGEDRYIRFSSTIEKESSFARTPKYSESFQTQIPPGLIHSIAVKAFERLEWDVLFVENNQVEAKRKNDFNSWTEKITVMSGDNTHVSVKSTSLKGGIWDNGSNSIRVKLFIHVFKEIESELDADQIEVLQEEVSKKENWDDYEIPESLPKSPFDRGPQLGFPILAGFISSLVLGGLFALTTKFIYIILLFESGVGIALAYLILQGVKLGNYTNYLHIRMIMGFSVVVIVIMNQYFQYLMIIYEHNAFDVSFLQFIELRLEAGFTFREVNTGWVGWLVVIALQLIFIYYSCWIRLVLYISDFQYKRVPEEVLNFALYHFVKGKSEIEVRNELAMKGWADRYSQDFVMEAIGGMQGLQELQRAE